MPSSFLGRNQAKFESWLTTTDGMRFRGVVMPAPDMIQPTAFINVRLLLRVRANEAVQPGMVFTDPAGRRLLVGTHDAMIDGGRTGSRSHALFVMDDDTYAWQRDTAGVDPVTNLPKPGGPPTTLGQIWGAKERVGDLLSDIGTRMNVEKYRLVTGATLRLHDLVGGLIVKRVSPIYGVMVAELE